jgi:flagellar assembly protein FliH
MLSRLLGPGEEYRIQPFPWNAPLKSSGGNGHAGGNGKALAAPNGNGTSAAAAQVRALEERIRELGVESELRAAEAHAAGVREGENAAAARLRSEAEALRTQVAEQLARLAETRSSVLGNAESDVLQLALEIARRIVHRELTIDPDAIRGLVKVALEKLQSEKVHAVRVHPEQEKSLKAALSRFGRAETMEIIVDPGLERGGLIFETGRGWLDASLDTQFREIERGFADDLNEN